MKKAHELTKIYQEAIQRKHEEHQAEAMPHKSEKHHAEAIKFCEEIGKKMEKAAKVGAIKYKTVIPQTILPLVRDILSENGYRISTYEGFHLIWWPLVQKD